MANITSLDKYTVIHSIGNMKPAIDLMSSDPKMYTVIPVPQREPHTEDIRLNKVIRMYFDPIKPESEGN